MRSSYSRLVPAAVAAAAVVVAGTAIPAQATVGSTLTAAYSVGASAINTARNLVFTISNQPIVPQNFSFQFQVTLPLTFTVSGTPTTTCSGGTITDSPPFRSATSERTMLPAVMKYVTGSLNMSTASCTATIPVTTTTEGTYNTCAANITGTSGIGTNLSTCASIYFEAPHPSRVR
ncbi:hypothetical protein [Actinokineospora inagensis]|uniref:hypothetical protein n=1 Tax=Actinokineospora inagensis TaxID=103730 RepID=UPI0012FA4076|nr:hypothetical protein [Actinokineospora inagensis]